MCSLPTNASRPLTLRLILALQLLLVAAATGQPTPAWNRSVDDICIYRDAAGDPVIFVPLKIEVVNPGTILDLSTTLTVRVNGSQVGGTITHSVVSDNLTQSCDFNCGSDCGPLYVDGVLNTMLCHETSLNDCACGYWITAEIPGGGLEEGDLIVVEVAAAAGGLPDTDTSDDIFRYEYAGEPMGWNRRLSGISIQETSAPGRYDISALIDLRADRTSSFLDLSTDVVLNINGDDEPPLAGVVIYVDDSGGDCETGCGGGCGGMYVDGVFNTMTCRLDGPGDCDCGHWYKATYEGVELEPGDVVLMDLQAASASMPEADTVDDISRVEFLGDEIGWSRRAHAVAVVPTGLGADATFTLVVTNTGTGLVNSTDVTTAVDIAMTDPGGLNLNLTHEWDGPYGFPEQDCAFSCGSDCGPMYLDGVFNTLLCRLVGPGDCECGYWLQTPEGDGIDFGDDPDVTLRAAARPGSGGAPDAFPGGDDGLTVHYDGSPIGWNRALTDVSLAPGTAGTWDVTVDYSVAMARIGQFMDMSCEVELLIDGVPVASQVQSLGYEPDPAGDNCEVDCSGGACGAFNTDPGTWIAAACADWLGFVGCSCGAILSMEIPAVPIPPGAVLGVILRPAPGALPELPGFEDDDRREIPDATTGVGEAVAGAPMGLNQNHPNPFNPSTTIDFRTAASGRVTLDIYDAQGSLVCRLVDEHRPAGQGSVTWDGRAADGRAVASGHYYYRLASPNGLETRKMSLIK